MSLAARPGNFGTRFHNFLYRELGLNFIYKAFTTRDICSAIGGIRALGIRGCAISMPFKEACIEYLDELDASAKGIMSVNTIVNTDGHLKAYNTDYTAVSKLLRILKPILVGERCSSHLIPCGDQPIGKSGIPERTSNRLRHPTTA